MKTKEKYLHIEIQDGNLYIFSDSQEDTSDANRIISKADMDNDCDMGDVIDNNVCISIPLEDFIK